MTATQASARATAPAAAPCIGGDGDDERVGERYFDPDSGMLRVVVYSRRRLRVYRVLDPEDTPPVDGIAYYEVVHLFGNGDREVFLVVVSVWGECSHEGAMCSPAACWCECRGCTERVRL